MQRMTSHKRKNTFHFSVPADFISFLEEKKNKLNDDNLYRGLRGSD